MTRPLGSLERSLRDGPPDESGYLAEPIVSTTRVRGARRRQPLITWQLVAAVLIAALALAGFGILGRTDPAVGGPSQTAASSPGSTSSVTFVSARNGFSIAHPAGWAVTPATASWPRNTFMPRAHPALDRLEDPGRARLLIASQPLNPGQTEEAWLAAYFHPYEADGPCGGDRSTWPRLVVDGRSGYLDENACGVAVDVRISDPDVAFDVLVFASGRVYTIGLDGDVSLAEFETLLATVRLDPSAAVD
jgi:hypothetical protein